LKLSRYYVCHYGPVGNFIGQQIYQPGRPCSSCPGGASCSASYSGLCTSVQGSQRNYTSSNTAIIIPRSEESIIRAPRVISSKKSRTANIVNARVSPKVTKTINPNYVIKTNMEAQRRYYEKPKPKTNRYRRPQSFSRRRTPCTTFLCRITNIFS